MHAKDVKGFGLPATMGGGSVELGATALPDFNGAKDLIFYHRNFLFI